MIPCYLTNRDCLNPIRGMVEHLKRCDDVGQITIVDCASTYQPLLDWYADLDDVTVIRTTNLGPRAPWSHRHDDAPFYFVSDGDLDISEVPHDFLCRLRQGLIDHPQAIKAGLSLRLDDLPNDLPLTRGVREMESQYWQTRIGDWYDAPIDTTAALYRGHQGWGGYGPAIRSAPPYMARHLAWYLRPGEIPPDWQHYLDHLSAEGILWTPRLKAACHS